MTRLALLPPTLAVAPPLGIGALNLAELEHELVYWVEQIHRAPNKGSRAAARLYTDQIEQRIAELAPPEKVLKIATMLDRPALRRRWEARRRRYEQRHSAEQKHPHLKCVRAIRALQKKGSQTG